MELGETGQATKSLYTMSCHRDVVNAATMAAFDTPARGAEGSFVRIELVDQRRALCGIGR